MELKLLNSGSGLQVLQAMDTAAMLWIMVSVSVVATILYSFVCKWFADCVRVRFPLTERKTNKQTPLAPSKSLDRWTLLVGSAAVAPPSVTAAQTTGRRKMLRQATERYINATAVVVRDIWRALQERQTLLLAPAMIQQGFGLAMTVSLLPRLRGA